MREKRSHVHEGNEFTIASKISFEGKNQFNNYLIYEFDEKNFSIELLNREAKLYRVFVRNKKTTKRPFKLVEYLGFGRVTPMPRPIKSYIFPDEVRSYFQNARTFSELSVLFEHEIDHVFYLGPLRKKAERDYFWAGSRPTDVGIFGGNAIDAILAATLNDETRSLEVGSDDLPFQAVIAHFLREMGLIDSFSVTEIAEGSNLWQARVRTRPGASEVLLTDVGFGVSQVLPVITLLQYVPEGSTVILEQPEIHLHPLAQAGLADVIIQAAVHRNVQVILESHSEHLLLRLQRRIAEQKLSSDDVKLYFCDAPEGVSILTPLDVDPYGSIRNWPKNFMGDAFGEVGEAEMTRIKRRKQHAAE